MIHEPAKTQTPLCTNYPEYFRPGVSGEIVGHSLHRLAKWSLGADMTLAKTKDSVDTSVDNSFNIPRRRS